MLIPSPQVSGAAAWLPSGYLPFYRLFTYWSSMLRSLIHYNPIIVYHHLLWSRAKLAQLSAIKYSANFLSFLVFTLLQTPVGSRAQNVRVCPTWRGRNSMLIGPNPQRGFKEEGRKLYFVGQHTANPEWLSISDA
jgi:hypothetical protein